MRTRTVLFSAVVAVLVTSVLQTPLYSQEGNEADCNRPTPEPVVYVPLESEPLFVQATKDGCWLFVRTTGGLTVLQRRDGAVEPVRPAIPLLRGGPPPGGPLTLTHDETILITRAGRELVFFDMARLVSGHSDPELGTIESSRFSRLGFTFPTLLVTPDDKHLLVSNHQTGWLSVIDLNAVRTSDPSVDAIVHHVRTAPFPTHMQLSPDGSRLFLTQARTPSHMTTPMVCHPSFQPRPPAYDLFGRGVISVVDMHLLLSGSAMPFLADIEAGCENSGMALSTEGGRLYHLAHGDDLLRAFDTTPVSSGGFLQQIATVPTPSGPRDLVLADGGRTIIVAQSFVQAPADTPTFVTVIDAQRVESGAMAVRGVIPTRSDANSLAVSADGRTLFVPNRTARMLQVIDLERVSLEPPPAASAARRQ